MKKRISWLDIWFVHLVNIPVQETKAFCYSTMSCKVWYTSIIKDEKPYFTNFVSLCFS